MTTNDFSGLLEMVKDSDTLKILFYLREFNPNVSVTDLCDNLDMKEESVREKLGKLEKMKIVISLNELYQLTENGRIMVNGFYNNIQEPIPKE